MEPFFIISNFLGLQKIVKQANIDGLLVLHIIVYLFAWKYTTRLIISISIGSIMSQLQWCPVWSL